MRPHQNHFRPLIALFISAGTVASADGAGPIFGNPRASVLTGEHPALADFNGDGHLDLALAKTGLRIVLNEGTGAFLGHGTYYQSPCGQPRSLAVGDLDGDGDIDVAFSTFNDVAVVLGNGDGTLGAAVCSAMPDDLGELVLGDFDADGDLDVAVAIESQDAVAILPNAGDGTFGEPLLVAAGPAPSFIEAGDLDGNGMLDLAVVSNVPNTVSVLLQDRMGIFTLTTLPETAGPGSLAAVDVDGDRDLDLLVLDEDPAQLATLLNDGDGGFTSGPVHALAESPRSLTVADLDEDGDLDAAVTHDDGTYSRISLVLNDGSAGYVDGGSLWTGLEAHALVSGDMDADMDADLVVIMPGLTEVSTILNHGGGRFAGDFCCPFARGVQARSAALGDVDGDGDLDVATALGNPDAAAIMLNDGAGALSDPVEYPAALFIPKSVALRDLNHDGAPELLLACANDLIVRQNLGDGTFGSPVAYIPNASGTDAIEVGDVDGDGDEDVLTIQGQVAGIGRVWVMTNDGEGVFTNPLWYPIGPASVSMTLGDLDGDGDLDVAAANGEVGNIIGNAVTVVLNDGTGVMGPPVSYPLQDHAIFVESGDLDGDGDLDLAVVVATGDGSVLILPNAGDGTFTLDGEYPVYEANCVAVGDLDGDEDLDLVVSTNDVDRVVRVLRNCGDGTFLPDSHAYGSGADSVSPVLGDVDDDGDLDLVQVNRGLFGSHSISVLLGMGGALDCPNDLDGDGAVGVSDLVIVILSWGAGCNPADLDGDGIVGVGDMDMVLLNWGPCG